jgi:hypothetical protein
MPLIAEGGFCCVRLATAEGVHFWPENLAVVVKAWMNSRSALTGIC